MYWKARPRSTLALSGFCLFGEGGIPLVTRGFGTTEVGKGSVEAAAHSRLPLMSAVTNLLARKQKLLDQRDRGSSDASREDIERQLEQVEAALELLEWLGPSRDNSR
jgi:hypothetical protein